MAVTSCFYSHSYWTTHCPVHGEVRLRAATLATHLKCQTLNAVTGTGRLLDPEKCFPCAATFNHLLVKPFAGNVGADVDRRGPSKPRSRAAFAPTLRHGHIPHQRAILLFILQQCEHQDGKFPCYCHLGSFAPVFPASFRDP